MKNRPTRDDEATTTTTARGGRLTLPLSEDGTIDWEAARPSQKKRFADLVSNDAIALEAIGLAAGSGEEESGDAANPFSGITIENVRTGLDILSQAQALAFKVFVPRFQNHPFLVKDGKPLPLVVESDILQTCFKLTDEQHKELDPRVMDEVGKHTHQLPEWFTKHLNVIMLTGMFLKYSAENGMKAIQLQVNRDLARVREAKAQNAATKRTPSDSDANPVNGRSSAQDQRDAGLRVGPEPVVSNVMPPEGSEATAP